MSTIVNEGNSDILEKFDYRNEYSDEFYEEYINSFIKTTKKKHFYHFAKRTFDFFLSLILMIVLSPVMLIISIAIKCDSKGPIIFKQKRMGKNSKIFTCYKFRTMVIEAPKEVSAADLVNPDQYKTKVGRLLRKLSLDELPQLLCVLTGKMSFIGYRPLILSETECNSMRERMGVFAERPGISGYAQVHGRNHLDYKNKAVMDAIYVRDASILFDIKLVFKTIAVILGCRGIESKHNINQKTSDETPTESKEEVSV